MYIDTHKLESFVYFYFNQMTIYWKFFLHITKLMDIYVPKYIDFIISNEIKL